MEGLKTAADLMAVAARTAPKSSGKDAVTIKLIEGEEIKKLAAEMVKYGEESGKRNFDRDGENVKDSPCVVLIGIRDAKNVGMNCGACGFETCEKRDAAPVVDGEFKGSQCMFKLLDLGIALGSAVKTASLLNIDNRIIYRIGVAARRMGLMDGNVIMGIPLSVTGKNIYFDR